MNIALTHHSKRALLVALFATVVALFLEARVAMERERRAQDTLLQEESELRFPDASVVRAVALNYNTAAADLLWISTLVNFGESVRKYVLPKYLIDNAHVIAAVDPLLKQVYEWFPAAYLNRRGRVSEQDLLDANSIVEVGMRAFPKDSYLPFSAALNFIGFSRNVDDARRLREINRGIEYLEEAISRPGASTEYEGVLAWFQRRRRQLQGDDVPLATTRAEDIAMLTQLLERVTSPDLREALLMSLELRGASESEVIAAIRALSARTDEAHQRDEAWVPRSLWLHLTPTATKE